MERTDADDVTGLLRQNKAVLDKLDLLYPVFEALQSELEDFKKSLGNGVWSWVPPESFTEGS